MTTTAKTIIEKIHAEASDNCDEPRFVRTVGVGQEVRQGDVYLIGLGAAPATGAVRTSGQVADGVTVGARHIVHGAKVLERSGRADAQLGPIIEADKRFELRHPEHADLSLPPGTYSVEYQRDCAAEERARVAD